MDYGRTSDDSDLNIDDIPPEVYDQIAAEEAAAAANRSGAGSASASAGSTSRKGTPRICPHCTFENSHGGSDCEVCGLPL